MTFIGKIILINIGNCSPLIQAPKTQQQFRSQQLWQDDSFAFGYDESNRLLLILSLRLSFLASFVQNDLTAREIMGLPLELVVVNSV